jgi:hypothetical protein
MRFLDGKRSKILQTELSGITRGMYLSGSAMLPPFLFKVINIWSKESALQVDCHQWSVLTTSLIFFLILLVLLKISLTINDAVEQRQTTELGQIDTTNYRPSAFLGLDLEVFWDRFSWFQLLISSLIVASLCKIFTNFVQYSYRDIYREVGSCQLIYPLVYNPSDPQDIETKYHILSISTMALTFLMGDLFPLLFMLKIIEVSLVKKRYILNNFIEKSHQGMRCLICQARRFNKITSREFFELISLS